jgi:hypothetical protein
MSCAIPLTAVSDEVLQFVLTEGVAMSVNVDPSKAGCWMPGIRFAARTRFIISPHLNWLWD